MRSVVGGRETKKNFYYRGLPIPREPAEIVDGVVKHKDLM